MKTKIYWRLALVVSTLIAVLWGGVYWIHGDIPAWYLKWFANELPLMNIIIKTLPSWMMSRWWDIAGITLFIIIFPLLSTYHKKEIRIEGIFSMLLMGIGIVLAGCGIIVSFFTTIFINILIGFMFAIVFFLIYLGIEYAVIWIPTNWQERFVKWLMQK